MISRGLLTARRVDARRVVRGRVVSALLLTFLTGPVPGANPAGAEPPPGRLAQNWEQHSPEQRSRALQNFDRYQRMPEQSRQQMERRWDRFQQMPPGEQDRIRRNFEVYRNMTPDARADFMSRYERYQGAGR